MRAQALRILCTCVGKKFISANLAFRVNGKGTQNGTVGSNARKFVIILSSGKGSMFLKELIFIRPAGLFRTGRVVRCVSVRVSARFVVAGDAASFATTTLP